MYKRTILTEYIRHTYNTYYIVSTTIHKSTQEKKIKSNFTAYKC